MKKGVFGTCVNIKDPDKSANLNNPIRVFAFTSMIFTIANNSVGG